jgi:hypothetical protein
MEFSQLIDLVDDLYFFLRYRNKEERAAARARSEAEDAKAGNIFRESVLVVLVLMFIAFIFLLIYVVLFK